MSCPSCLSPRLEGRDRAGGQGWGGHRARHCCSHRSPLSFLLEPPELQHHVIWDLPGRGGGGGLLLPPCLMPTPCPAPHGRGLKAKEKYPFGFFLLCFFFLREVIFYSGFILKEKEKPKKKKKASISILPPFPLLPGNSTSALKPKRASFRSQGKGLLLQSLVSAFLPRCCPHPGDPLNMVPERQVWRLLSQPGRGEG